MNIKWWLRPISCRNTSLLKTSSWPGLYLFHWIFPCGHYNFFLFIHFSPFSKCGTSLLLEFVSKFYIPFQEKPLFSKYIPKVHREILYQKSSQKLLCVGMRDYVKWTGKQINNYRLSKKIKAKASEHYSVPHFQELTHKLFWEGRQHKANYTNTQKICICVYILKSKETLWSY